MMMSNMMNNDDMMNTYGNHTNEHRKNMQDAMSEFMKSKNHDNKTMKAEKIKAK